MKIKYLLTQLSRRQHFSSFQMSSRKQQHLLLVRAIIIYSDDFISSSPEDSQLADPERTGDELATTQLSRDPECNAGSPAKNSTIYNIPPPFVRDCSPPGTQVSAVPLCSALSSLASVSVDLTWRQLAAPWSCSDFP